MGILARNGLKKNEKAHNHCKVHYYSSPAIRQESESQNGCYKKMK